MNHQLLKLAFFILSTASMMACGDSDFMNSTVSPNCKAEICFFPLVGENGSTRLHYCVSYEGAPVVGQSLLGFVMDGEEYGRNVRLVHVDKRSVDESYVLPAGKRRQCRNHYNETVLHFKDNDHRCFSIVARAYDDGVAFKYLIPGHDDDTHIIDSELTEFNIPSGKAWIHPYDWNGRMKPSYEQYAICGMPVGTPAPKPQGWAFPMLFENDGLWTMVTEAYLDGSYPACHIDNPGENGSYKIRFPEMEEPVVPDDPRPSSSLPWETPWRVIITGQNLDVIFSTQMVQNLCPESSASDTSWIKAGKSAWSWWYKGSTVQDYEAQKSYVDLIDEMGWDYSLIDSGWARMDGEGVEGIVRYAKTKGKGIWLWYRSGAGNDQEIMSDPERRIKEMERISAIGVKGIKVDFFDTDKQRVIALYPAILADALKCHLMVDLHGATLPRGFERTYPNLMTTEAVRGAESLGSQDRCDRAAQHNATLPFTRNVVGSMDYTPVTFSNKIKRGVEAVRRTSVAHQLALSVVFESGFQCLADRAEAYLNLPPEPKDFIKKVPAAWDESHLLAGYPGDYAIIARRSGNEWYIGGINGRDESRIMSFKLPDEVKGKKIRWITDGEDINSFGISEIDAEDIATLMVLGNGGFCALIE